VTLVERQHPIGVMPSRQHDDRRIGETDAEIPVAGDDASARRV